MPEGDEFELLNEAAQNAMESMQNELKEAVVEEVTQAWLEGTKYVDVFTDTEPKPWKGRQFQMTFNVTYKLARSDMKTELLTEAYRTEPLSLMGRVHVHALEPEDILKITDTSTRECADCGNLYPTADADLPEVSEFHGEDCPMADLVPSRGAEDVEGQNGG